MGKIQGPHVYLSVCILESAVEERCLPYQKIKPSATAAVHSYVPQGIQKGKNQEFGPR